MQTAVKRTATTRSISRLSRNLCSKMLNYSSYVIHITLGGLFGPRMIYVKSFAFARQYDVLILSDEIHADLVLPGFKHIPLAKLAEEEGGQVITCIAPTKTFNLAGVQAAVMITKEEELRVGTPTKRDGSWPNGIERFCRLSSRICIHRVRTMARQSA